MQMVIPEIQPSKETFLLAFLRAEENSLNLLQQNFHAFVDLNLQTKTGRKESGTRVI